MRHTLQVLKGIEPEVVRDSAPASLPLLATANDVRGVVQYLRKRPEGVTLSEAIDAIKKQVFEPPKIAAYEALDLVEQAGNLLKLTPLGWELARSLEPETRAFCRMLGRIEPYHSVLVWAERRQLDYLIHPDVAAYWREQHPQALGINTPKMIEANVGCFFQLCQAAALGTNIIGKKGQPTRLRFDREALAAYVANARTHIKDEAQQTMRPLHTSDNAPRAFNAGLPAPAETMSPARNMPEMKVLIVCAAEESIAAPLRTLFALADVPYRIAFREQTDCALLPLNFLAAMRECQAAVIVLRGAEQLHANESAPQLNQQTQTELSVALALYERRIVLLCDEPVVALPALMELAKCRLTGAELSWAVGLELMQLVKNFRQLL
jgi:hypothetical protein